MSADNGIFVFRVDGGFGVVHHTMSAMPLDIPSIMVKGKTCYGDDLRVFPDERAAIGAANVEARRHGILEYGVVDWTDYDWQSDPAYGLGNELIRLRAHEAYPSEWAGKGRIAFMVENGIPEDVAAEMEASGDYVPPSPRL